MIFDFENNPIITCRWLSQHGYRRGVWGSPEYFKDSNSNNHRNSLIRERGRARWRRNSFIWEKITEDDVHIVYFPPQFNKYVNIDGLDRHPNRCIVMTPIHQNENAVLTNVRRVQDILAAEVISIEKFRLS